jgi:serine/threonine protein kinase
LPTEVTADAQYRERFEREAELAAGLSHPHVVGIHDRGECEGRFWISMAYVAGADAARLLRERYPHGMPAEDASAIITAVASALDYSHTAGCCTATSSRPTSCCPGPAGRRHGYFCIPKQLTHRWYSGA